MQDEKYKKIFEDNKAWVNEKINTEKDFFHRHYEAQNPDYLYIGCSDSRVPAGAITGLPMGDLFVHRNIANIVANNDINMMSILQYAVDVLEVKHIVVCGHYGCGGLKAAMEPHSYGVLDNWLRNVRDVYRFHKMELDQYEETEAKMDRLAELNVEEQCINVIKSAAIQSSYIKNKRPSVHGWIYDMRNGILKDLDINFEGMLKKIQEIYNLEDDVLNKSKK